MTFLPNLTPTLTVGGLHPMAAKQKNIIIGKLRAAVFVDCVFRFAHYLIAYAMIKVKYVHYSATCVTAGTYPSPRR